MTIYRGAIYRYRTITQLSVITQGVGAQGRKSLKMRLCQTADRVRSQTRMNFDQSPLLVIWETTKACDLACSHCRRSVQSSIDPGELTTAQGLRLLEEVKRFGNPL